MIPDPIKKVMILTFCWITKSSKHLLDGFLKFSKPEILDRTMILIRSSIRTLRYTKPDLSILSENKKLLKLYYGTNDGWVPLEFYRELKDSIPDIEAEVDTYGIDHSIVWKNSNIMGKILSEMIDENRI